MLEMANSTVKAKEIIKLIEQGVSVEEVKAKTSTNPDEWFRFSSKAYNLHLENSKRERKMLEKKQHVSVTSDDEMKEILALNKRLAEYALMTFSHSTRGDLIEIRGLSEKLPDSELDILNIVGKSTLNPTRRAIQKRRIKDLKPFKEFSGLIDAALLSFYRTNFIACYLTLAPVIEGIVIRWNGYKEGDDKPPFKEIKEFFKQENGARRQPCPSDIQFHQVFSKGCDSIFNLHFYRDTKDGDSWSNFNRHVAAHLLNDKPFGTKENCIRLFMLLDAMVQIYLFETKLPDPRFSEERKDVDLYSQTILDNLKPTAEHDLLDTGISDLPFEIEAARCQLIAKTFLGETEE